MALDLDDPNVKIKITVSVCSFVAMFMTLTRLWIRRGRYWWDDAWSFFSMLCLFIQIVSVFMHVDKSSSSSQKSLVAAYYLMAATFYVIIWSARLSILLSIIRLDPDLHIRKRLSYVAAIFVAAILFFLAQLFWTCETERGWKEADDPQCNLGKAVAICQVVSDVFADLLLIVLPLRLIHGIKDIFLRRRLYFIFSTSIVTTIVSLVHAAYIITDGGIRVVITALVEDCMSLSVANVPVVATAVLRMMGVREIARTGRGRRVGTVTTAARVYEDETVGGPRFEFSTNRKLKSRGAGDEREAGVGLATTTNITTGYGGGGGRIMETRRGEDGSRPAPGGRRDGMDALELGTKSKKKSSVGKYFGPGMGSTTSGGTTSMESLSEGDFAVDGDASDLSMYDGQDPNLRDADVVTPTSAAPMLGGRDRDMVGEVSSRSASVERTREEMERRGKLRSPPGVPPPAHYKPDSRSRPISNPNPVSPPLAQAAPRHFISIGSLRGGTDNPSQSNRNTNTNRNDVGQESYDIQWTPETSHANSSSRDDGRSSLSYDDDGEDITPRRQHYISVGSLQGESQIELEERVESRGGDEQRERDQGDSRGSAGGRGGAGAGGRERRTPIGWIKGVVSGRGNAR